MKRLPINKRVSFNEEEHTYTLDNGTQLSGITSIIHKLIFPSMYNGVSESVMAAARERGHLIHKVLQDYFESCIVKDYNLIEVPVEVLVEYQAYRELEKQHKLQQVEAEYLVSDNRLVATCIDSVLKTKGGYALVDYKSTSIIYEEYLRWQLSIEAFLFEQQTGKIVTDLYAIHLPKPKDGKCEAKLISIERIENKYVVSLLSAFELGAEAFENPLHTMCDDTRELLKQYREAELSLVELRASVKYYEDIQTAVKEKIKEQMAEESASKWEDDEVTITRKEDSVRKTFKMDALRSIAPKEFNTWLDENIDKCYAETKVNGSITIKFK